ncbi:MAG TPA: DEAD/DEAH box helicase [Planctomycetota bacterium]|nr:DEAD/DEAH box helicase [Planctomycetota bacterium]
MTANEFALLGLSEPILRALAARDYSTPTPIQTRAIPHLLEDRDLLGIAQTGTGKTAAFALPMLQRLAERNVRPMPRMPRSLVLVPTRELATQVADSFEAYGRYLGLRVAVIFGGVGQNPQVQILRSGIDVLVATPGRLLDLMQQRHCDLSEVETLVLDEADRMLDMGFLPDVRRILSTLPRDRQSLLFSATMPPDITALANNFLRDPLRVEVSPPTKTADLVTQSIWFVAKVQKRDLLAELLGDPAFERTLVFTRTKHGADKVVKHLRSVRIPAHAIHGNKSQSARERALDDFRSGRAHVLVATDIAARGIDVPDITHVINFDLPNIPESYVHRIGRTARAGRSGIAISFCDHEEREYLRDIEKLIKQRIAVAGEWNQGARKPAPADPARRVRHPESASTRRELPRPAKRNRPEPREARGPYVPQPPKPPAQEGRRGHGPARHGRPHGGHKHRPATPNYVDPEQRRKPQQPHLDERDERTAKQPHWIQQPGPRRSKHSHRR